VTWKVKDQSSYESSEQEADNVAWETTMKFTEQEWREIHHALVEKACKLEKAETPHGVIDCARWSVALRKLANRIQAEVPI